MVVRIAPVVGEPVWRKERSCPRWDVLDPDTRTVGLHDQPRDGETESHAAFAALLWRTTQVRRIEFEGARCKVGPNFGESEFFGLSSSAWSSLREKRFKSSSNAQNLSENA